MTRRKDQPLRTGIPGNGQYKAAQKTCAYGHNLVPDHRGYRRCDVCANQRTKAAYEVITQAAAMMSLPVTS